MRNKIIILSLVFIFGLLNLIFVSASQAQESSIKNYYPVDPNSTTAKSTSSNMSTSDFYYELAAYYAPVIYQDTDDSACSFDYITNVDFDGDWVGNNNWDNAPHYSLKAYVYYHVVETTTHWFIGYSFFHPRDWSDTACWDTPWGSMCHENDIEGILVVIKKDGSTYGKFIAMETKAHKNFYQYANPGSGVSSDPDREDLEEGGVLLIDGYRPAVDIEPEGHGVHSVNMDGHGSQVIVDPDDPYYDVIFAGGDGIVYRYEGQAEIPSGCNARDVGYNLVSLIDTLWQFRFGPFGSGQLLDNPFVYDGGRLDPDDTPFGDTPIGGSLDGDPDDDAEGIDSASTPWSLDDHDDGAAYAGDWAIDPAYNIDYHLTIEGSYSYTYTYNPFLDIGGEALNFASITKYVTVVKDEHITELRTYIDKLRVRAGLSKYNWSSGVSGGQIIYASHITELRTALSQVYQTLHLPNKPTPTWSESLSKGVTIKLQHIQEIRDAISNIWNG